MTGNTLDLVAALKRIKPSDHRIKASAIYYSLWRYDDTKSQLQFGYIIDLSGYTNYLVKSSIVYKNKNKMLKDVGGGS